TGRVGLPVCRRGARAGAHRGVRPRPAETARARYHGRSGEMSASHENGSGDPVASDPPPSEGRNPETFDLDRMSTLQVLEAMNKADHAAIDAVETILPDLAQLVEQAAAALQAGGTVHYFGAGTSGRLGVLDAAELLPTF